MKILVINGLNMNILGWREPERYGTATLADVEQHLQDLATAAGVELECFQSNYEGAILERLQAARGKVDVIIINPGGLTHHGGAVCDTIKAIKIPVIDVHVTNLFARRGDWAHSVLDHEVIAPVCAGVVMGFGIYGYDMAFQAALQIGGRGGGERAHTG